MGHLNKNFSAYTHISKISMPPYKRQNTLQTLEDFINNNIIKMYYPQTTPQNNNNSTASTTANAFETYPNFPFNSQSLKFAFHSKIQKKSKMINSKKLFFHSYKNKIKTNNSTNTVNTKQDRQIIISKINTFKTTNNQITGRKRALESDSKDIDSSAKLIKIAIDDQSKPDFDSKLNLRDTVVNVFNQVSEIPKISKSLNLVKYQRIPLPTLKNIADEVDMLIDQMIENLSTLKNCSNYAALRKYCVILKDNLVQNIPENYKDLLIQAIGNCNV